MLQHAENILHMDHGLEIWLDNRYVNGISMTSSHTQRIFLPDLAHLSFGNRTSSGFSKKWNQTKKSSKSSDRGWNDLRIAKTSYQHHDCVTTWSAAILILIPSTIALMTYEWKEMLPATCQGATGLKDGGCTRACLKCVWSEIIVGGVKVMSSWFPQKLQQKKYTNNAEPKNVKRSWKTREKAVKNSWKGCEKLPHVDKTGFAFLSGMLYFHLWMCNQIEVHAVHLKSIQSLGGLSFMLIPFQPAI